MLKKIILTAFVILFSISLFGCGAKQVVVDDPPKKISSIEGKKVNENIEACVYIDGTYSMAGYVDYPIDTAYVEALKEIERTVSTWEKSDIKYFKFGNENNKIEELNRNEFLQMDQTSFYRLNETNLQRVIAQTDDNKSMNIIITDMFQTDRDTEGLMIEIKKKLLSNSESVFAMVGIKSQFNGTIYDFSKDKSKKIAYTSKFDDKETFRPFYLLILGDRNVVETFVNTYSEKFPDKSVCKSVLFANSLSESINIKESDDVGIDDTVPMMVSKGLVSDEMIPQYRLKLNGRQYKTSLLLSSDNVVGTLPAESKNYGILVEAVEKLEAKHNEGANNDEGLLDRLNIFKKDDKKIEEYEFKKISSNVSIKSQISELKLYGNSLKINLEFVINTAVNELLPGVYRINYAVVPNKIGYLNSVNVFKDWDIRFDALMNSKDKILGDELGRKTLNISKFTDMVGSLNYEINRPGVYDMYIYVDVKN